MKNHLALCALLWVPQAFAQTPPPSTESTTPTGNEAKHARSADARHCLDLKTNLQVIRCAEKYRWQR